MKITTRIAVASLCVLFSLIGCTNPEEAIPIMDSSELRSAVQGKWNIERIDNKLCRDTNCNVTYYIGSATDHIEFRGDSMFITRAGKYNVLLNENYKTDYTLPGAIIVTAGNWSGRFIVQELRETYLVLKGEFIGRDPAAVFTDTYYLKR